MNAGAIALFLALAVSNAAGAAMIVSSQVTVRAAFPDVHEGLTFTTEIVGERTGGLGTISGTWLRFEPWCESHGFAPLDTESSPDLREWSPGILLRGHAAPEPSAGSLRAMGTLGLILRQRFA